LEIDRVIPVIQAICQRFDVVVSVDTSKSVVMREAVAAGARLINDVRALQGAGALSVAATASVPVCLMHMQGRPETMQASPHYQDVVDDVLAYLNERKQIAIAAGIAEDAILLDPGFGFGKSLDHNLLLLKNLGRLQSLKCPLLIGVSRKSMLGAITGKSVDQRLAASLAVAVYAALNGASILRVHDVDETVDALKIVKALRD
jgi:dihydropteroate synthase